MIPVRLRPELLDDVAEAFAWYEAQAEGIELDFTRAFFEAVARASRQPQAVRVVHAGFRRVRLRRFPHSLYYRAEATETVFFLLFHGARSPDLPHAASPKVCPLRASGTGAQLF